MTKNESNTEAAKMTKCNKGHELKATGEGIAFGDASTGRTMLLMAGFFACPTCRWAEYAHDVRQPRIFDAEGRRVYVNAEGSILAHAFELSGCGRAPFQLIGFEYRVGPFLVGYKDGIASYVGAPGQPCGVCEHCGTGIAECCVIQDATGKTFIVGNVCVGKTGDNGLRVKAKSALAKHRSDQRKAREAKKLAMLDTLRGREDIAAELAKHPHPYAERKYPQQSGASTTPFAGMTRLDWALWNVEHAGTKGKLEVLRFIEKTCPALLGE